MCQTIKVASTFSTIRVQWINKREHHAHYFLPLKVLKYDSIQNLIIWIGTMKFLEMLLKKQIWFMDSVNISILIGFP